MQTASITTAAPFVNAPLPGARVVVGLSGGVDSAVSAMLLARHGFDVQALFMKNWEEDDTPGHCAAADDLRDAGAVCEHLGIPLRAVNLSHEYWERVFERFLAEHERGRTPNPDVLCNEEVKFRAFVDHARRLGAARIATGHYAGLRAHGHGLQLVRSIDEDKDQTYFLHRLDQDQLAAAMFPLEGLTKRAVRGLARDAGLPVHDKPDSTGICFVGERSMRPFLERFMDLRAGPIVSLDGERLGRHAGLSCYTIGQRQGLGIGGRRDSSGAPWYVAHKRVRTNELVVVQGRDHPALFACALTFAEPSWTSGREPPTPLRCRARIRHRQPLQDCVLESTSDGLRVEFDRPQRAVTPGQSVALYLGPECLGGGVIEAAA